MFSLIDLESVANTKVIAWCQIKESGFDLFMILDYYYYFVNLLGNMVDKKFCELAMVVFT